MTGMRTLLAVLGALLWSGAAVAQGAPADSALAAACAGGDAVADGLLLVEFRADVPAERRAAMVTEAGGRVAGPVPDGGPGAWYVAVPASGRAGLDAAADRLIRFDGVQAVGGAACPPPALPVAADTGARDTTASAARDTAATADSARPRAPGDTAGTAAAPADTTLPRADSTAVAVPPADSAPGPIPRADSAAGAVPPADSSAIGAP